MRSSSPAAPPEPPRADDTLVAAALKILQQPEAALKAEWTQAAAQLWRAGDISAVHGNNEQPPPDTPSRSDKVALVQPWEVPRLGRGGTPASRIAMIHSLTHIEGCAIDLAWDAIARFVPRADPPLPRAFCDDFVTVAEDEARHFTLLEARLWELGSHYGALPAHAGLWESAAATGHSLPARLAVESCVHEARGLDVLPQTIARFRNNGDAATAQLLEATILPEEVAHCGVGVRWLTHLYDQAHARLQRAPDHAEPDLAAGRAEPQAAARAMAQAAEELAAHGGAAVAMEREPAEEPAASDGPAAAGASELWSGAAETPPPAAGDGPMYFPDVQAWFHALVRRHFRGKLKPPFNTAARQAAGFDERWYLPLV